VPYIENKDKKDLDKPIGAISTAIRNGAKMEAYRRIAVPYEDSKISANGDVFPPSNVLIRNCLSCGVGGEAFSVHGDCLECVMQKAGFDKKVKSLSRQDVDIESLVDEEHKE
jgi:hypothetical protein